MFERSLAPTLERAMSTFRIAALGGARQVGKTTLLRARTSAAAVTLDSPGTLEAAVEDPTGFIRSLAVPATIDEFQRAGGPLLLAIKERVDSDTRRGQFVISGSANYLASRSISETLAGRTARLNLWPLSVGERYAIRETFLDRLFDVDAWPPPKTPTIDRADVVRLLLEGGYPEVVVQQMRNAERRMWFEAYVTDTVSKEALQPLASIRLEDELRRVFRLLAARSANELVVSDIARDAGLARPTATDYVALLEALYLVVRLPAWATSATTRAKRRPKILVCDSGLAADLCGAGEATFEPAADPARAGALFESFVIAELCKQRGWAERSVDLAHFRDRNGAEVDCIIEDPRSGLVAGVEVKFSSTPRPQHARHLDLLRNQLGTKFTVGVVVHCGDQTVRLGERIWGVPVGALLRSD